MRATAYRLLLLVPLLLCGCIDATFDDALLDVRTHVEAVTDEKSERLSLGKIQQHMNEGMSGGDVIDLLGSPNIVTTDAERREIWVYDRIYTIAVDSSADDRNNEKVNAHIIPGLRSAADTMSGVRSGAKRTSQKTITVIVKFDDNAKVRDYAYRLIRF